MAKTPATRPTHNRKPPTPAAVGDKVYRLLVDSITDYGIILLDPDGKVTTWNAGAQRLLGYTAAEAIGRPIADFYPPEEVQSGRLDLGLRQALAEGRFEHEGWRVCKDGSRFWVHSCLSPVRDRGRLLGFAKVASDATARKQAEDGIHQFRDVKYRLMEAVRAAVNQISAANAELLASTAEQASSAQEQAAAVAQTVATVNQVTQAAEQGTQRARMAGESAQRNLEQGQAGRRAIEESLSSQHRVKELVETTATNIVSLAEQAQAIGEIIATVSDIAEQTNLLALNAAIEASRAGEHGRGFSVVAGEVKALADQSKKATVQVRQILSEIQKATNAAVVSTEEVTRGVASAIKLGGQVAEIIMSLAATLEETMQTSAQIVASANQQSIGMGQIHQAMKSIDQAARQNMAALQQAEQAVQNLNELSNRLTELVRE